MAMKSRCSYGCVAVASVLLLVPAVLVFVYLNNIFLLIINDQAYIKPGGFAEQQWVNPDTPVYIYFNFYELLNENEVKHGLKPAFQEVGPFVYREHREKYDLKYLFDETVVQYRMNHYFTLDLEKSTLDPRNYTITTLNIPLAVVLAMESRLASETERNIVNAVIAGMGETDLFVTKTVDELLWGYDDPVFSIAHKFEPSLPAQFALQQRNITDDANLRSRIFTGKGVGANIGKFVQWHEMNELPFWGSPAANAINGTDGTVLHTNIQKDHIIYAFIDTLFRSGYFTFNNSGLVRDIDTYRFVIPASELYNDTTNAGNKAFFMDGPAGMMNMSALSSLHPPVFMSKPHFLDTPQRIIDSVVGLPPDRAEHDSFMDVHPLTGAVLNAHKRMQVNVHIKPQASKIYDTTQLRDTYFPIMWIDETATITPDLATKFKDKITVPISACTMVLIALIILTSCGLLVGTAVKVYRRFYVTSDGGRPWRRDASLNSGAGNETTSLLQ